MNERIEELANQAKLMVEETINRKISVNPELYAFAGKFAELIVQECIKSVEASSECFTADQVQIKKLAVNKIKRDFGVKE